MLKRCAYHKCINQTSSDMLSAIRTIRSPTRRILTQFRTAATQAQKRAGDISDAFVSLSGQKFEPLSAEYAELKGRLIRGHESAVQESWERLLRDLREEIPLIIEQGRKIIPEIDFKDLDDVPETFSRELRKRGVAVVRNVVPEQEILQWKAELKEYIRQNPHTKGKPHRTRASTWYDFMSANLVYAATPSPTRISHALTSLSLPSRQPPSFRTILVAHSAPRTRPSQPPQVPPLPNVLLA